MISGNSASNPEGQLFVATTAYDGDQTKHQLSFSSGSVLVARAFRGGWYWGRLQGGREEGYFHPNHVRAVETGGPPPLPPPLPSPLPAPLPAPPPAAAATSPVASSSVGPAPSPGKTKPSVKPLSSGATRPTIRRHRWLPPPRKDDGSDIAAGTALAVAPVSSHAQSSPSSAMTRKRPRPSEDAPASALAAQAARAAESSSIEEGTRINTRTTAASTESSAVRIPVPTDQANGTRFPPGCPVLHDQSRSADNSGSVVMGVVRSAYLELSNPAFVPGSAYDVSYVVASEGHWTDVIPIIPIPEKKLQFAPRCRVSVSSSFLPAPLRSANGDENDGWVSGTIVSSFQSFGGSDEESYIITLEGADGAIGGRVSGVPRSSIRYRPPSCKSAAPSVRSAVVAADTADPATLPGRATAKVLHAAPPSVPHSMKLTEEDVSKESSSRKSKESSSRKKRRASSSSSEKSSKPVILRRIDIPGRIDFERVKSTLVGPNHSINKQMMKNLRVFIYVIGRDLPPPKDTQTLHYLRPLLPDASDGSLPFVMLRGSDSKVSTAAKVIMHLLVDRAYQGEDRDGLKKELNSAPILQSVIATAVADSAIPGKEAGGARASKEGSDSASREPPDASLIGVNRVDLPKRVKARVELPWWLQRCHVENLFATDGLMKVIQEISNCTVSIESTATQDKESSLYILVCGLEMNSVEYASTLVKDILVKSGVEESDIVEKSGVARRETDVGRSSPSTYLLTAGAASATALSASCPEAFRHRESKESQSHFRAESEDEPKLKRSRVEPGDEARTVSTSNGARESRLQYFPSWINIDDIISQLSGQNKRVIEERTGCKIQVVDRCSIGKHVHAVVTNDGPSDEKRIVRAMECIEDLACDVVDTCQKNRFLYDMALCNSNNAYDDEKDPIVYQRSLPNANRMVWMAVIELNDGHLAGFMIGTKGANVKRMRRSMAGCYYAIETCKSEPGSYIFIADGDRERVEKAQQLVIDEIEAFKKIIKINTEAVVFEGAPLRLDQFKSVYSEMFGTSFDHKSFGFDQLSDFICSIPSIYTELSSDGQLYLHHDKKRKGTGVEKETTIKVEHEQPAVEEEEEVPELRQKDVQSKTQVAKAIDAIVRDCGPLPLARLKPLYSEKYRGQFDQKSFGYNHLRDFVISIPTIDVREEGRTTCVYHKL